MLIAFDFDGTLSDSEMTVLLGEEAGVADRIAAITEQAMNDEISYADSLRQRAELLGGLQEEDAQRAWDRVQLHEGAAEILNALGDAGHHVAIITGGFEPGVRAALEKAGTDVDTVVANHLPVGDYALTGEVEGPLVEGTKDEVLERLAAEQERNLADTVAIGDGANDLPMLQVAGLAVGFDPKPVVGDQVDVVVHTMEELATLLAQREILPEAPSNT